jgi:hypothetical protein
MGPYGSQRLGSQRAIEASNQAKEAHTVVAIRK